MTTEPLAIEFANTWYAVRGKEKEGVGTPADLVGWLRRNAESLGIGTLAAAAGSAPAGSTSGLASTSELGDETADEAEVTAYLVLRDAVRALLRSVAEDEAAQAKDVESLNESAAAAPRWPALTVDFEVTERTDHGMLTSARAAIARDAIVLLSGPTRQDIRSCHAPGCVLFFLKDHPRREWCSAGCGNRARAARHYRKQHT